MSEKSTLLANRISGILQKLNSGKVLSVKELSTEYGVSERTIQKDLNERLDPKLIEPLGGGQYRLVPGFLGNITIDDIKEFSRLSGIIDLYPDIDEILRLKIRDSLLVQSRVNPSCMPQAGVFSEIHYTINSLLKLKFSYNDKDLSVEPYMLLNHGGIWYLLAKSNNKVKSYCLHRMKKVRRDVVSFQRDELLLEQITENPSPWFREEKTVITLRIIPSFVEYFINRRLFPDSFNHRHFQDGSMEISLRVNTTDEIKGEIKFWLPNIDVITPDSLREEIVQDIKTFIYEVID